jgi:hypothetical protein
VVRHRCGLFQRAAVLEIRGDPGRAEAVIAALGCDAGGCSAPAAAKAGIADDLMAAGWVISASEHYGAEMLIRSNRFGCYGAERIAQPRDIAFIKYRISWQFRHRASLSRRS